MAEYHLDPQELATVYLHAVDGESLDQIAERQGVSAEAVRRTMRTVRRKTDSSTTAQACIRVLRVSNRRSTSSRTEPARAAASAGVWHGAQLVSRLTVNVWRAFGMWQ